MSGNRIRVTTIDFAKMGYRTSNKVNATKQMALYIQRMEAISMHAAHLLQIRAPRRRSGRPVAPLNQEQDREDEDEDEYADDAEDGENGEDDEWDDWFYEEEMEDPQELADAGVIVEPAVPLRGHEWGVSTAYYSDEDGEGEDTERQVYHPNPEHDVADTPTVSGVLADYITKTHGATRFEPALHKFLHSKNPSYDYAPFTEQHRFNLWTRARLFHLPPPFNVAEGPSTDVIRAHPLKRDQYGHVSRRARFDTVLIETREERVGIHSEYICRCYWLNAN